jgi:hypothetical protein
VNYVHGPVDQDGGFVDGLPKDRPWGWAAHSLEVV